MTNHALDGAKRLRTFMRELQAEGYSFESAIWITRAEDTEVDSVQLASYPWDGEAIRLYKFNGPGLGWSGVDD